MSQLNVLVIHGMGSQTKYYSHPMRDEIDQWLGDQLAEEVNWGEVYWANVLKDRQAEYFNVAK